MVAPRLRGCYGADYPVPTRYRNLEKLRCVAQAVQDSNLARLIDPGVLDLDRLYGLHDPAYMDAFLTGEGPLATSQKLPWSPELRRAVIAMQAGQLTATALAMTDGIAGHIANGFHHARYERGRGFCTFNGLALVAHAHPSLRVFVLDCDDHGGDGTAAFTQRLANLYNYSICATRFGYVEGPRSVIDTTSHRGAHIDTYTEAIDTAMAHIEAWQADLVLYQAGADPHVDDAIGNGRATRQSLYERDYRVFSRCRALGLPVVFTLSGGYQSLTEIVELHANTFLAARQAFATSNRPVAV